MSYQMHFLSCLFSYSSWGEDMCMREKKQTTCNRYCQCCSVNSEKLFEHCSLMAIHDFIQKQKVVLGKLQQHRSSWYLIQAIALITKKNKY